MSLFIPWSSMSSNIIIKSFWLNVLNRHATTEKKSGRNLPCMVAADMQTMVHTFEFVVFWVSWEERIRKQFGEGEASILGPVLHVVPYSWLQLLHELWAGRSQLLYDFIPLVNIWTLGVKENPTQAPDPNLSVWPLPGNPQRFPLPPCSLCRCTLFHYYAPGSSCPPRTLISHMSIISMSIAHIQTQPQVWEFR